MTGVAVPAAVLDGLAAHARRVAPEECCGLLIGRREAIETWHEARNAAARPRVRYLIDPADHFAAIRRARLEGLEVVGAYHSHPAGPVRPSDTDRAEAFPDFLFLIVSLEGPAPQFGAWELRQGNFMPVPLVAVA